MPISFPTPVNLIFLDLSLSLSHVFLPISFFPLLSSIDYFMNKFAILPHSALPLPSSFPLLFFQTILDDDPSSSLPIFPRVENKGGKENKKTKSTGATFYSNQCFDVFFFFFRDQSENTLHKSQEMSENIFSSRFWKNILRIT